MIRKKEVEDSNRPNHEAADAPQQAKHHWNNADQSENFQISRSNRRSIHRTAMAIHINT